MTPMLKVTEQGQTRWVTGDATPATPTALARIDVDATVRSAIDAQSAIVREYMRGVGSTASRTVDQAPQRADVPYSSAPELTARNHRFYAVLACYIAISAVAMWGLVQLAILADVLAGDWWLPSWLAMTGIAALVLVRWTHAAELQHTPEGLALVTAGSAAYAEEKDADGRNAIALAVATAIEWRAQSEYSDSQARQLATESMYASMHPTPAPDARRFAVRWQAEDAGMMTLATEVALQPSPAPPQADARRIVCSTPAAPDAACLAMMQAVSAIYADCRQRGDDLVTTRLPWSQRGDWPAAMKRQAQDVLGRMDPPLLLAGDGGRWRLNTAGWCEPLALGAIRRRWPRD